MTRQVILSAIMMALSAGVAFPQAPATAPQAGEKFFGQVQAVNTEASTLTLINKEGVSKTFAIPITAAITSHKGPIALSEIKVDSEVEVMLDASGAVKSVAVKGHHHREPPATSTP